MCASQVVDPNEESKKDNERPEGKNDNTESEER
jgi:hypothetical protein